MGKITETTRQPSPLSDSDLLRRFLFDSDQEAFAAIVRRHQGLVRSVCRRVTGSESDIDDAFQVTFLQLARRPGSVKKATSLSSWLYTVAWRVSVGLVRKRSKLSELPLTTEPSHSEKDALEQIASQQDMIVLDEELNRLPTKYRNVLVMTYFAHQSSVQIADQLKVSKGTVDGRIRQARNMLRVRLARRGIALGVLAAAGATAKAATSAAAEYAPVVNSAIQLGTDVINGSANSSTELLRLNLLTRPETIMTSYKFILTTTMCIAAVLGTTALVSGVKGQQAAAELDAVVQSGKEEKQPIESSTNGVEIVVNETSTPSNSSELQSALDRMGILKAKTGGVSRIDGEMGSDLSIVLEDRIQKVTHFDSAIVKVSPTPGTPNRLSITPVAPGATSLLIEDDNSELSVVNISIASIAKSNSGKPSEGRATGIVRPKLRFSPMPPTATAANQWQQSALDQPCAPLDFPGESSLAEILKTIEAYATAQYGHGKYHWFFYPDIAELELENVNSLDDVTIRDIESEGLTFRQTLKLIFEQTTDPELTYVLEDGVAKVTTVTKASDTLYTNIYEVGVLLEDLKFEIPVSPEDETRFCEVITEVTSPPAEWLKTGAKGGTIHLVGSRLMVRQTPLGHQLVTDCLELLSGFETDPNPQPGAATLDELLNQ